MSNRTLLIVTPDRLLAEQLFHALRGEAEVKLAYDGVTAARRLVDWLPELILVDDQVSGVDGWSFAELLMLEPIAGGVTTVVLSGESQTAFRENDQEMIPCGSSVELIAARLGALLGSSVLQLNPPPAGIDQREPPAALNWGLRSATTPATQTSSEPPTRLGDVLRLKKTHLGGIPNLQSPASSGTRPRADQPRSIPRPQADTQQPRAARSLPSRANPNKTSPEAKRVSLTSGEFYLVDAAFADFAATPPTVPQSS